MLKFEQILVTILGFKKKKNKNMNKFHYLLIWKACWTTGKQCTARSDAVERGVWSPSTLFI